MMLHLDFTDAEKETLLIGYVQAGIDLYGVVQDGGRNHWPGSGGNNSGRKWPILFAGMMLGDPGMRSIGSQDVAFGEDTQCFYVAETPPGSGVYNNGYGGYGPEHLGMPEWGIEHAHRPQNDTVSWTGQAYRLCCTANAWWGQILAARIMDAESLWNHDSLFDSRTATTRSRASSAYRTGALLGRVPPRHVGDLSLRLLTHRGAASNAVAELLGDTRAGSAPGRVISRTRRRRSPGRIVSRRSERMPRQPKWAFTCASPRSKAEGRDPEPGPPIASGRDDLEIVRVTRHV